MSLVSSELHSHRSVNGKWPVAGLKWLFVEIINL